MRNDLYSCFGKVPVKLEGVAEFEEATLRIIAGG